MTQPTPSQRKQAREWIAASDRVVGFTGAGISTESGIPDFRSPNGIWATNRTVLFSEFVASRDDRIEYWRQKSSMWPEMRDAQPNAGHRAFAKLAEAGKLLGLITQNIEGLHQKAGLPADAIVELHGSTVDVACLGCGQRISMDEACARVAQGDLAPECDACGDLLKPATISFGQMLDESAMARAAELCRACEVMIAAGSSLVVHPAADFPVLAKNHGARLIIINRTPTPLDALADLVVNDAIGDVLPGLVGES